MKKIILFITMFFVSVSLFGCSKIQLLEEDEITVVYKEEIKLNFLDDIDTDKVSFTIEDDSVLSIEDGKLIANSIGTTTLIVTIGKNSDSCIVNVVSDFELSFYSITIPVTQVRTMTSFTKQDGVIVWTSSNEEILIIEERETMIIIRTLSVGQAIIKAELGEEVLECVVIVE